MICPDNLKKKNEQCLLEPNGNLYLIRVDRTETKDMMSFG